MKKHCIIMTCVCVLVLSMFAHADAVRLSKDYLFKDMPVTSVADNAKIDALLFNSSNSNIYGQILVPNAKFDAPRPVVLMFHGFAGFTRWDDVGHALCQAGAVVVIPHHRGAWGSEGEYSVTNCIEDAVNLANYVHSEEFIKKYNTSPDDIYLLGHSMGGNTVTNAAGKLPFVKGVMLLAPCDVSALFENMNDDARDNFLIENGSEVLHSQGTAYIKKNIVDNSSTMIFTNNASTLSEKNVFIAAGSKDDVCPKEICVEPMWKLLADRKDKVHNYKIYEAEHSLMGTRISLINDLIDFINS